jgi:hypothetical protein
MTNSKEMKGIGCMTAAQQFAGNDNGLLLTARLRKTVLWFSSIVMMPNLTILKT